MAFVELKPPVKRTAITGVRISSSERPATGGQAKRPAPPEPLEIAIHRAVVEHLQRRARPGVWFTHVPSGEPRGPGIGGKLKGMGTKPGVPDLMIVAHGKPLFLELKRAGGRVSELQTHCHKAIAAAGAKVHTAYGLDDALAWLESQWVLK